jgi:lysophospholipase L1-like esterase
MDRKIPAELRSITPNWIKLRGIKGRAHKGGKHTWLAVTPEFRWNENPKKPYLKKAYDRRNAEVEACQGKTVDIVMLGDSLTWNWEVSAGRKRYAELTNRYSVLNLGIPGDRVEHLLWRCRSGQLDGYKAKFVTVLIGVNNIWRDSADDILEGIRLVCDEVDKRQPDARLVMLPVFPSGELPTCERRRKIVALNRLLREEATRRGAYWMDFYEKLLQPDGTISKSMMHDFVHIGDDGYRIWLDAIYQLVKDPSGKWKKRQLYTESSGRRIANIRF